MSTRRKDTTRAAKPCTSILVWLCIAILVAVTGGSPALAQDNASATPEGAVQEAAPVQPERVVQKPAAVPIIVPPTAAPTMAPTPTSIPLEQSPTPVVDPAPTAAAHLATSPSPTVEVLPSPTPSPTPAPTVLTTSFAAASVDVGNGALTTCSEKGPDVLSPGGILEVECFVAKSGKLSADFTLGSLTSTVPGATTGWSARLTAAGNSTGWTSGGATLSVRDQMPSFTIELRAPQTGGAAGAVVSVNLSVGICNYGGNNCSNGSTTVSASLQPSFDLSRVTVTCGPQPIAITRLQEDIVLCTVDVPVDAGASMVSLNSVTLSALPEGWSMTTSPAGTIGADGSVTIAPGVTLAAGSSWSFTVTLSPSCGATSPISLDISSRIAGAGTEVAGPSATINAQADDVAPTLTPSLVRSDLDWAFPASWEEQVGTGTLEYAVAAVGCNSWSVSVAAGPFLYSGPAPGTTIGPADLRLTSAGAPVTTSGEPGGVAATVATGSLDTATIVMTAEEGGGNGTYVQELGIAVTVPGGTPAGTYQSTITITASSAP